MTRSSKRSPTELSVSKPRASIPFRAKLTVIALLAVPLLLLVGFVILEISSDNIGTLSRELQLSQGRDLANTIEGEFRDAQDALDAVGRVLLDENLPQNAAVDLAINLVASHETLDHVAVYSADGGLVDVIREERAAEIRVPEKLDEAILEETAGENVATGKAVEAADGARFLIAIPLRVGDRISGYVASMVSLEGIQARSERLVEGFPNSLFVVDDELRVLVHSDAGKARGLPSAKGVGVLEGVDPRVLATNFEKSGGFIGEDGIAMVGTLIALDTRPWAIVVQVPEEIAYASLFTMRKWIIGTTIAATLLALIFGFLGARQITRPIRQLSQFAEDLAARRFDRRVTVHTRDELAILGDVMSSAAADLQASEEKIRKEVAIRGDLGRYLPAELVDKVVRREQDMGLGGRRSEITVLFADVVSFTPLADTLRAEHTVALLNELFTILTEIVFRHEGTVDKFIGDCVMAVWGAPEPQSDHAERALATAEDMMRWLEAGNRGWQEQYGATIELAIGINSGDAVVGNIGSETRMQYTAVGDVVNVAARLEAIARPQQILISEATRQSAGDRFEYRSLGPRQLVGRSEPVHLFEVTV